MDYRAILERYTRFRSVTFAINNTLPKLLPKTTLERAARQLGLWHQGTLVLDSEDQIAVLMDYAIHDCPVNGRSALDAYLAEQPPAPQSERATILHAMQRAYYSLFQVESLVPTVGVHVHDLLQDQRHFLADVGCSQSAVKGIMLASRMFALEDFLMTSGAALAADADTLEAILRLPGLPKPGQAIDQLSPEPRAALHAAIIRLCLRPRNAAQVLYQGMDEDPNGEAEEYAAPSSSQRVGRNDPCPCGSGRKYKKCCGR